MSKIFKIKNDTFRFQEPTLDIEDIIDFFPEEYSDLEILKFSYNNIQMTEWWGDINSEFQITEGDVTAPIPDICTWLDATLILSEKAHKILTDMLEPFGEFLPITCGGKKYYIFNCLTFCLIDEINSQQDIQNGAYMGVKKLQFNSVDIINKTVFKTQFNRCMDLFCNIELKNIVEMNGLQGIVFDENLASHF